MSIIAKGIEAILVHESLRFVQMHRRERYGSLSHRRLAQGRGR